MSKENAEYYEMRHETNELDSEISETMENYRNLAKKLRNMARFI